MVNLGGRPRVRDRNIPVGVQCRLTIARATPASPPQAREAVNRSRGKAGSGGVVLCTRREQGRHGVMDAVPESFADARVVGALGQFLDGKRETHIRTLRGFLG